MIVRISLALLVLAVLIGFATTTAAGRMGDDLALAASFALLCFGLATALWARTRPSPDE